MSPDRRVRQSATDSLARSPFSAYRAFAARLAGVVLLNGVLVWMLPKRALLYWQAWAPADWSEQLWGVDAAQALVFFLPDFFASRVTSPFVMGPLLTVTVVTLLLRNRSARS